MGGTAVATLVKSGALCGTEQAHKPLGLASSTLPHQPLSCPRGAARSLCRQWTTAKPGGRGDVSCNVLPFFLDLSLAFAPGMEFFDAVKSSVDSEVVFQATLQVPAHHALACRLNAYGTPFAAPDLQAAAHELRDEDLEFAACLATPPDLDEQLSVNFGRVMSLLEKNQGQGGGQIATRAVQARADAGSSAGSAVQQQLRAQAQKGSATAPKVLVSVDEAETTAAQLQRTNSAKKQPKWQALMDGYGKRALQSLLGLGYLLTYIHEKSLGGKIEFTAALTAATIISPTMSDDHVKARSSSSGFGMLAGLRQLMRECPSLSPLSPNNSMNRRQTAAAAAAAAAAQIVAGGSLSGQQSGSGDGSSASGSTPRRSGLVSSFEAAWDRVLHPPLVSSAGGVGPCQGLQLQLSLSAPCRNGRRMSSEWSSNSGSTPRTPLSPMQRQQQEQAMLAAAASAGSAGAAAAARAGSPLGKGTAGHVIGFHTAFQQQQQPQQDLRWPGVDQEQQQKGGVSQEEEEQQGQQQLAKMQELGRGGDMDAIIDDAIQQMQQRVEPSATDLVALGTTEESVFARAAAAAAASGDASAVAPLPCTPVRAKPPLPPQQLRQQQQHPQVQTPPQTPGTGPRSFYLADQGPLTSPLCARWAVSSAGGVNGLKPLATPFGSPWQVASSPVSGAGAAGQEGAAAAAAAGSGSSSGSVPGTPQRMLLPVMSMRLTCQPAWQYNSSTGAAEAEDHTAAAQNGSQERKDAPPAAAAAAAGGADVSKPSLTLSDFIAATDAAATGGSSGSSGGGGHKPAVHMHQLTRDELRARQQEKQCEAHEAQDTFQEDGFMASPVSCSLPQGLWPTVSFSLVPVRLQGGPTSPKGGGFRRTSGASCLA